jgi:hypothetical protein
MKKVLTSLFFAVSAFSVIYLVGCFANATFYLKLWSGESRAFVSIIATIAFIAGFAISYSEFDDFNKKK